MPDIKSEKETNLLVSSEDFPSHNCHDSCWTDCHIFCTGKKTALEKEKQKWGASPSKKAIDKAAKVGWVETILRGQTGHYSICNSLRHHILDFKDQQRKHKILNLTLKSGSKVYLLEILSTDNIIVSHMLSHLWDDRQSNCYACYHVRDQPLQAVFWQPAQNGNPAFHLLKFEPLSFL